MRRWTKPAKFRIGDKVKTILRFDAKIDKYQRIKYKKGDIMMGRVIRIDDSSSNPNYDVKKHLMPEPLFYVHITSWNGKKHDTHMHCGGQWLRKVG